MYYEIMYVIDGFNLTWVNTAGLVACGATVG